MPSVLWDSIPLENLGLVWRIVARVHSRFQAVLHDERNSCIAMVGNVSDSARLVVSLGSFMRPTGVV